MRIVLARVTRGRLRDFFEESVETLPRARQAFGLSFPSLPRIRIVLDPLRRRLYGPRTRVQLLVLDLLPMERHSHGSTRPGPNAVGGHRRLCEVVPHPVHEQPVAPDLLVELDS